MSTHANTEISHDDPLYQEMQRERRNRYILGGIGLAVVIAAAIAILFVFIVSAPTL